MYAALVSDKMHPQRITLATKGGAVIVGDPADLRTLFGPGACLIVLPDSLGPWIPVGDLLDTTTPLAS